MVPELNPLIIICKTPAYDERYFNGHGYTDAFWYSIGKDMESNFIGWNGNHSSNASNVLEDFLTIKKNSKKPIVRLKFKTGDKIFYKYTRIYFTNPTYPIGRCYKV